VREILSIGHSTQRSGEFLERLDAVDVELVVDVRRHPGSRRVPWTSASELQELLAGPTSPLEGDGAAVADAAPLYAGECVARIRAVEPAAELTRKLAG
jgi:hypothetical protein